MLEADSEVRIKFWGVRGSVPAPLVSADVEAKVADLLRRFRGMSESVEPEDFIAAERDRGPFTYGGNTSCVEITYRDQRYVLDLGTGVRALGNSLFGKMTQDKGLSISFFLSHVHWDHIQGLPFFGPLYANKHAGIKNRWSFWGGSAWIGTAEVCLKGQMDAPTFPISFKEIELITESIEYHSLCDRGTITPLDGPTILCGKLNHPQETYGFRFSFPDGPVVVYTTDHEPYDPLKPDPRLLRLIQNADLWITDCQYTQERYNGEDKAGVARHGWGHSYPEAVAKAAEIAKVKKVVLYHHDPDSSDDKILEMQQHTQSLLEAASCEVISAYEGLVIAF